MRPLVLYRLDLASSAPVRECLHAVDPRSAQLTVTDLGPTRGDGIFETVALLGGVGLSLGPHLDRLERSARLMDLPAPRRELWAAAVDRVAADLTDADLGRTRCAAKLVMTRGDEAAPGTPTGWVLGFDSGDPTPARRDGLSVVSLDRGYRHDVAQTSPWLLQGAKSLAYAVNKAALREAERRGADDVLFISGDGYVLEGPSSTLVARIDGVHVTPPLDMGILLGTTQLAVFEALAAEGLPTQVRAMMREELAAADALWLCSSTRGAIPVTHLDGVPQGVDRALSERLNQRLDARKA